MTFPNWWQWVPNGIAAVVILLFGLVNLVLFLRCAWKDAQEKGPLTRVEVEHDIVSGLFVFAMCCFCAVINVLWMCTRAGVSSGRN